MSSPQGMNGFLRGYFHLKSGDAHNDPRSIIDMSASELAKLPPYCVMPLESSMRDVVRDGMTPEETCKMQRYSSRWLPDDELAVYVDCFSKTGFQGGLNWYRVTTTPIDHGRIRCICGEET